MSHRVLLVGSPEWDRPLVTAAILAGLHDDHPDLTIIHSGIGRGAENDAAHWCRRHDIPQEVFPLGLALTGTVPERTAMIIDTNPAEAIGLLMSDDLDGIHMMKRAADGLVPARVEWYERPSRVFDRLAERRYEPRPEHSWPHLGWRSTLRANIEAQKLYPLPAVGSGERLVSLG